MLENGLTTRDAAFRRKPGFEFEKRSAIGDFLPNFVSK
jgi:hypothetical protein